MSRSVLKLRLCLHARGDLSRSKASAGDSIRCAGALPYVARAGRGESKSGMSSASPYVPAAPRKKRVALRWACVLAAAAALSSLCAPAVQQHPILGGVEGTGAGHGEARRTAQAPLQGITQGKFEDVGLMKEAGYTCGPAGHQAGVPAHFVVYLSRRRFRRRLHRGLLCRPPREARPLSWTSAGSSTGQHMGSFWRLPRAAASFAQGRG